MAVDDFDPESQTALFKERQVNCHQLAEKLLRRNPAATPTHVARLSLMLLNSVDDPETLADDETFNDIWTDVRLKFQAATDQHAAMTQELEDLACSDPRKFTPDQIWILVRAIKVQSQVLKLYAGESSLATS